MLADFSDSKRLAARLHDVAAGLSIGIGFARESDGRKSSLDPLPILETALADLKRLMSGLDGQDAGSVDLVDALEREAARLEIEVKLRIDGEVTWLSPDQLALFLLFCREGLRNSRRHSGGNVCGIDIELARCPWVVRVRDWGAGIQPVRREGNGLALIGRVAAKSGSTVRVTSHPGMGTEIVMTGPPCGRDRPGGNSEDERRRQKTQIRRSRPVISRSNAAD
jgi:signal transduction histidine kinase